MIFISGKLRLFIFFFTGLLGLLLFSPKNSFAAENTRNLRVGIYDNKPKEYLDTTGAAKGLFPDILNYIAAKEGWQITYILKPFAEVLTSLEKGEIDMAVDIDSSSPVRQQMFEFPKQSVISSWGIIFVHSGSDIQSFTDLNGKKKYK